MKIVLFTLYHDTVVLSMVLAFKRKTFGEIITFITATFGALMGSVTVTVFSVVAGG